MMGGRVPFLDLQATRTQFVRHYLEVMTVDQFRAFLRSRGTQAQIAAEFGVSRRAVAGWMAGEINPSRTVLILAGLLAGRSAGEWPLIRD